MIKKKLKHIGSKSVAVKGLSISRWVYPNDIIEVIETDFDRLLTKEQNGKKIFAEYSECFDPEIETEELETTANESEGV